MESLQEINGKVYFKEQIRINKIVLKNKHVMFIIKIDLGVSPEAIFILRIIK